MRLTIPNTLLDALYLAVTSPSDEFAPVADLFIEWLESDGESWPIDFIDSILARACYTNLAAAKRLLNHNPSSSLKSGEALVNAIRQPSADLTELLIKAGAPVDWADGKPLKEAAKIASRASSM